jgi:hypothetical protein
MLSRYHFPLGTYPHRRIGRLTKALPVTALACSLALSTPALGDSVIITTATSASYSGQSFSFDDFSLSGPSFSLSGGTVGPIQIPFFSPGDSIGTLSIGFPAGFEQPPYSTAIGQITDGNKTFNAVFDGSGKVSAFANGAIWPSGPHPSVTIPAVMTGMFSGCISSSLPKCDSNFPNSIVDISVNLPGKLTLSLDPTTVLMEATFDSTPVPEPSAKLLVSLAGGLVIVRMFCQFISAVGLGARRRRRLSFSTRWTVDRTRRIAATHILVPLRSRRQRALPGLSQSMRRQAYLLCLAALRTAAHRFFCAAAILCRASGLNTRFFCGSAANA